MLKSLNAAVEGQNDSGKCASIGFFLFKWLGKCQFLRSGLKTCAEIALRVLGSLSGRLKMTKKQTQTSITALIMGLGLFGATQALADTVAVTADQMIDVRTGMVMKNPTILIKDGVIIEVKTQGSSPIKADRTVNLKGITLVPGLIDMHTHIDSLAEVGGYNYLQYTDTFWTYAAASNAKKTLDAGFTVIRNVGSAQYNDVGLSQAIDAGLIQGPRVIPAANAFGATGGHCDETFFPPSFDRANPYNADNPAEGIKSVRTLKKMGRVSLRFARHPGCFHDGLIRAHNSSVWSK